MIKKIASIILLLTLTSQCLATDFVIYNDLNSARMVATQTNQNILLIFTSDNCRFCQKLKSEILDTDLVNNFVVCTIDIDDNRGLSRKFKARSLPTSILLDKNLEENTRIIGYNNEKYILWLESNQK